MNEEKLFTMRMNAALDSKGTSSQPIRSLAVTLCELCGSKGDLLDFGSGIGDLLQELRVNYPDRVLAGVDIMERPTGLPEDIVWYSQDLNLEFQLEKEFDVVISTEVIEHLENPRATLRNLFRLLKPGGILILTTPNQNSLRSLCALCVRGHFVAFLEGSYPAHITALTITDLSRILLETGLEDCNFFYTNHGGIPKLPHVTWQSISFGMLKGKLFSDNVGLVARKPS